MYVTSISCSVPLSDLQQKKLTLIPRWFWVEKVKHKDDSKGHNKKHKTRLQNFTM